MHSGNRAERAVSRKSLNLRSGYFLKFADWKKVQLASGHNKAREGLRLCCHVLDPDLGLAAV
jgi:hypothetical protein